MIELGLGVAIGLVVGWWFLPQPMWMKNLWTKISGQ